MRSWTLIRSRRLAEAQTHTNSMLIVRLLLVACRAAVGAIVREKELRLREGMRILGLKVSDFTTEQQRGAASGPEHWKAQPSPRFVDTKYKIWACCSGIAAALLSS